MRDIICKETNLVFDEFFYKKWFLIIGILFLVYGFYPAMDIIQNILLVTSILPILVIIFKGNVYDFRIGIGILIGAIGVLTLITCSSQYTTGILLYYLLMKILLFGYCNNKKNCTQLSNEITALSKIVLIIGTIVLIISLITFFSGVSVGYISGDGNLPYSVGRSSKGQLTGILGNPNIISCFCVIYLGATLFIIEKTKKIQMRLLLLSLIIMDLIAVYFTASRGGVIGTCVALFVYISLKVHLYSSRSIKNKKTIIAITSIFFVFIVFVVLFFNGLIDFSVIIRRSSTDLSSNFQARLLLWRAGLLTIIDNPQNFIFGIGTNISESMGSLVGNLLPEGILNNTHNSFIQMAVYYGIPSLLLLIIYFAKCIIPGLINLKNSIENNMDIGVLIALLFALLFINFFETYMSGKIILGTIVWMLSGYIYSISLIRSKSILHT
jgi:hypothetical protein